MGWWDRVKVSLGLEDEWVEDEHPAREDDLDDDEEYESPRASTRPSYDSIYSTSSVRRVDPADSARIRESSPPLRTGGGPTPVQMTPQVKMVIVEPRSFTEAQSIADKFKQGNPVILKLTAAKPEIVRRYIDFASGLVYGLDGGLQKIDERVYMLTPRNVEVSDAQRRQMRDTGVFTID